MPRIIKAAISLMALILFTMPANAAVILNISVSGTFDGSLDGELFTGDQVRLTGLSANGRPDEVYDEYYYYLTSLIVTLGGANYQITEPTVLFISPLSQLAGIVDPDATKGLVRFEYGNLNRFYDDAQTQAFATSGGPLLLKAGSNIAVTGISVAAVPEPKTWAMMLLGFAILGIIQRISSKRSNFVTTSFQPTASYAYNDYAGIAG